MNNKLLNELTTYVKDLISHYELEKSQEWQKGWGKGYESKVNEGELK